jgi:PX domain
MSHLDISYEITTTLEDVKFIRTHKYADFLYLEEYIKKRCDPMKAPWIDRDTPDLLKPDIKNFGGTEDFIEARISALEQYLAVLVADPRYMIEPVIEFLGIESPYKDAYLGYNGYLKNTSHKENLAKRFKKDIQEIEMKRFDPLKPQRLSSHQVDDLPFFSCFCKAYQKAELQSHYEYVFVVTDQNDPTKVSWTITKTYKEFKDFHESLEGILGAKMPLFERLVPKPTDQSQTDNPAFIEKRKEGLEKYLNHILKNRSNYKDILYEFLEYHFAARKESSKNVTPRSSFFDSRNN